MRHAVFGLVCLGFLGACDGPQATVSPVTVQWMEWPAEVNSDQPFRTRLVVWGVCALNPHFFAGASADQSAVTFAPYYLVGHDNIECLTDRSASSSSSLLVTSVDTAGTAPGLTAPVARSYEMRASASAFSSLAAASLPIRTFGVVVVRPTGADQSRRNAAGDVNLERDSLGCARVRPVGLYGPDASVVLEDQADTAGLSYAFVRGYIHDAAAPVCGQARVFHLESRN